MVLVLGLTRGSDAEQLAWLIVLCTVRWECVNVGDFGSVTVRKCRGHMGSDCHEKVNFGYFCSMGVQLIFQFC